MSVERSSTPSAAGAATCVAGWSLVVRKTTTSAAAPAPRQAKIA
jgi:hypothetical protein